ncbi:hypothetical protein EV363DRAFT_1176165 [Boletus edulis]|nr:hypothetical protein EV363DRAFT_1176165 [Boletus edulis]
MSDSFQDVYAKHLLKRHVVYGYPLWTPEPMSTLPEDYQEHGLQIGDVGTVDSDGQFDVLFNICKRSDNPLHTHGVPENFQPVEQGDVKSTRNALSAHPIYSHGIQQFATSARAGAILLLPQGAMSVKLVSPEQFRNAAMKSARDWYEFAKKRYGLQHHDLDRSLYLITGFYKARSWSLGSFNNSTGATGKILAQQNEKDPNVYPLAFEFPADSHNSDGASGNFSQTIFITGFKITLNSQLPEVVDVTKPETTWSILVRRFRAYLDWLRGFSGGHKQPMTIGKL